MSSFVPPSRSAVVARCATAIGLALLGGTAALAQARSVATTTYPANLDRQELLGWMKHETDIPPGSVVAISPLALIAIMQTQPTTAPQGFEVTVRAEILDPAFASQEQLLSWHATIKLDCRGRAVSVGEATGHAQRNLLGEGHPVEVTASGWKPVAEGTMQGQIWSARCDSAFKPPLAEDDGKLSPPISTAPRTPTPVPTPVPTPAPAQPPAAPPTAQAAPSPAPGPAAAPAPGPAARAPSPQPKAPVAPPVRSAQNASVQILASPTPSEAEHALARLRAGHADLMAGLKTEVVAVQAGTTVNHRAIVAGFQAAGDATRFCKALTAAGGKCFVRGDLGLAAGEHPPAR